ncbi:TonB-dependent receptor plug domain-containing protein [Bowmanella dokdonensis]|uniref:TonB-dependent receptor n=1 Tax=Bowmanella dokdonensis TaxID=751969 RepID=A0A939DL25_9ALTE|nr:TonB-dependent receptor [Bowmanella dokdonensis]MBN7824617.1 TonB-dependent receptor [Bowmanella dokdonensis]
MSMLKFTSLGPMQAGLSLLMVSLCLPLSASEQFQQDGTDMMDFYGDVEFVSIATGTQKPLNKAPAVASVITAAEIAASGARSLAELLQAVPGVHVAHSSQLMAPKFIIRGIASTFNAQTLVLIDGVPISSLVRGDRHTVWGHFPVQSIQRIEVLRGPGSAIYGADAFAGVVNIITKTSADIDRTRAGAGAGSFNSRDAWLNTKASLGELSVGLSLEYLTTAGHGEFIHHDAQTNLDLLGLAPPASLAPGPVSTGYEGMDVRLSASYRDLEVKWSYQDRDDVGTGQGIAFALDPEGRLGGERSLFQVRLQDLLETEHHKVDLSVSHYRSSQNIEQNLILLPPGTFFGAYPEGLIGNPAWQERTSGLKLSGDYARLNGHQILWGLGYRVEEVYSVFESKNFNADFSPKGAIVDVSGTDEAFLPTARRENAFAFVQDEYRLSPDWALTAGLRYDHYSDFGDTFNPRLALVWATTLKLTTKFLYGRAFRAPAFAETEVINNPVALGNPALAPEVIDTLELAFNYQQSAMVDLYLNLYLFEASDLISFVPDDKANTATAQNFSEVSGLGAELESRLRWSENLDAVINLSWQHTEDSATDSPLAGAPSVQAFARLNWKFADHWTLYSSVNFVGERKRGYLDYRKDLEGYVDVALTLHYQVTEQTRLTLRADNLLSDNIRETSEGPSLTSPGIDIPGDIPQAGRAWFASLEHRF